MSSPILPKDTEYKNYDKPEKLPRTINSYIRLIVIVCVIIILGSFLAIIYGPSANTAALVTIFTATLTFLGGLFIKSPTKQ